MNIVMPGDCKVVLPKLPKARMIFADPPDNLGMAYAEFHDKWPSLEAYYCWLWDRLHLSFGHADVVWWSVYHTHRSDLERMAWQYNGLYKYRMLLWRFKFGQHRNTDCGNGFRPLMRFNRPDLGQ